MRLQTLQDLFRKALTLASLCSLLSASSCIQKDEEFLNDYDNNKINLVVADNFNLSAFSASLRRSGMGGLLQQEAGPFTVLAPSDAAFANAGYGSPVAVLAESGGVISRMATYHTLDGKYELNRLPFLFNQELRSRGGRLFATHWIKDGDTVLTINGSRILAENIPASNGLIQVIDRVLTPYVHDYLGDAIAADQDITLFSQALKRSGMLETINGAGPFTVFAPNNAAMQALGYTSVQQINASDPAQLRALVSYHILNDRRFIYDYILSAGPSNSMQQAMLDGNLVTANLLPDASAPGGFSGISLRGIGNLSDVGLMKQDVLTGNGVLHVIEGSLRITQ